VRTVEVVLTSACNLDCAYCYQNRHAPRSMNWPTLRAAADLLLRSSAPEAVLTFYGGEPLLRFPAIRRCVDYVNERLPAGKSVRFTVITNGLLLGDTIVSFLEANRVRTRLSFDGLPAAQRLRGASTFARLDGLLDHLREKHPGFFRERLCVGITLTAATIPTLAGSVEYLLAQRVPEIDVAPPLTHDPDWRPALHEELDRQFRRIYCTCILHAARTGRVPLTLFRKAPPAEEELSDPDAVCRVAAGDRLTVDVDGRVYSCAMLVESYQELPSTPLAERLHALRLGQVDDPRLLSQKETHLRAVRDTGLFHDTRRRYSSFGRCGECRYRRDCTVCPVSIVHQPGNSDPDRVPDFICAFNRTALAWRDRFPAQLSGSALLEAAIRIPSAVS
jgi:uncharacterized protein